MTSWWSERKNKGKGLGDIELREEKVDRKEKSVLTEPRTHVFDTYGENGP